MPKGHGLDLLPPLNNVKETELLVGGGFLHIKVSDNDHIRWRGRAKGKVLLVKRCIIALD